VIHLDTHVVVWLSTCSTERLSARARSIIEAQPCMVSPAVVLELQYLHEIGRLSSSGPTVVETLADEIGLQVCALPFDQVIREAVRMKWTRDPFDRIITATAQADESHLLTRDLTIRRHFKRAVWD